MLLVSLAGRALPSGDGKMLKAWDESFSYVFCLLSAFWSSLKIETKDKIEELKFSCEL